MKDFIFKMPARVRMGIGLSADIGRILKEEYGYKKAFIATDKGIVNAGIIGKIEEGLQAGNMDYVVYDALIPDPTIEVVDEAADILRNSGADVVLAVGGGHNIRMRLRYDLNTGHHNCQYQNNQNQKCY